MMKLIDIHCHPLKEYYDNPKKVVKQAISNNVAIFGICGCDIKENDEVISLVNEFPSYTFAVVGIHPSQVWNEQDLDILAKQAKNKNVKAIGEIGLDFSYETNPNKEQQIQMFKAQIEIALQNNLPIVIHLRDAAKELLAVLKEYKNRNLRFVIHTYSQDLDFAKEIYELGGNFSFSGTLLFNNKKAQEVVKWLPIERIFTETDSPYLAPPPHRGEINYPNYVKYVLFFIAGLKELAPDKLAEKIYKNTKRFFNLND
ncbi:TatD DNase family protein [Mycoplasmopsis californica]|uniref:TatD family hydrolase n=1 Tax=Mycoplasmopsis equigenitalium TaxID=114883 RepID=A0ABY5J1E3_9BACT|nr:TatD family hydrolase [Mycoplasmopsis equigenitalium]UUD37070.1 TatD family hydrolase [Mycoplasmopsis equigenitalium]VEU69629.1 TatD DNase family protein [Mycoplasmopsis californica]